jgi:hypothetical protein
MERAAWTDARLDDFAGHVGSGLRELRQDIRSLREEMRTEISGVRGEIGGLRSELRGEIDALRVTILRVGGGMMVGLVGVIAAVLARGV